MDACGENISTGTIMIFAGGLLNYMDKGYKMKNCKKCFLAPDMCGAKNDKQKCERIYESKGSMRWEILREFAKTAMLIVFLLAFLVLSGIYVHWHLSTGTPLWR